MFPCPLNVRAITEEPWTIETPAGEEQRSCWNQVIDHPGDIVGIARAFDGEAHVYFCPQTVDRSGIARKSNLTKINALVLDCDFKRAGRRFPSEELLEGIAARGLPPPTAIVFTGGGFHVYWGFAHSFYTGPRKGHKKTDRQRKLNRLADWYREVALRMVEILAEFGADPKACDLPHLFRVPGVENPRHGERVQIVHLDVVAKTSLKDLSTVVRKAIPEKGFVGKRSRRGEPTAPSGIAAQLLNTRAWRWYWDSTFEQGFRNHAFVEIVAILRMAGVDRPAAWAEATRWRRQCTRPTYPDGEAKSVFDCVWRSGYGLHRDYLERLENSAGQVMSSEMIEELLQAMPSTARKEGTRRNYPRLITLICILEKLHEKRIYEPTVISARELSQWTGRSPQQVEAVARFLDTLGIRKIRRVGRSNVARYDLSQANPNAISTLLLQFNEWMQYKRGSGGWVRWWLKQLWRRFRGYMLALNRVVKAIIARLGGCQVPTDPREAVVVPVGVGSPQLGRAPPLG